MAFKEGSPREEAMESPAFERKEDKMPAKANNRFTMMRKGGKLNVKRAGGRGGKR